MVAVVWPIVTEAKLFALAEQCEQTVLDYKHRSTPTYRSHRVLQERRGYAIHPRPDHAATHRCPLHTACPSTPTRRPSAADPATPAT
jgi:hypothetical protein